ncbi:MAG: HNH endonuclease [Chloroflexota bacterium]|nr:HNH endonuclease [Chloroflexota bacterium]MDE2968724.1 HNH endonuclease [Chloroflexota bacterium]
MIVESPSRGVRAVVHAVHCRHFFVGHVGDVRQADDGWHGPYATRGAAIDAALLLGVPIVECGVCIHEQRINKEDTAPAPASTPRCAYCGRSGSLVRDHKTPVSRGGGDEWANLQLLCYQCNMRKGTLTDEEFRHRYRRLLPPTAASPLLPFPKTNSSKKRGAPELARGHAGSGASKRSGWSIQRGIWTGMGCKEGREGV